MDNGSNPELIFLISQPRAGSTLLQKLLAAHSDVATASEPWVMLPPASVFRKGSVSADYNADWAAVALDSFIETLPQGRATYTEGLRRMYGYLYGQALSATEGRVFLDKTPRYYLIVPQLLEIFPDAKIVLLIRNPLAVLVSIVRTWCGVHPGSLKRCRNDLLLAPGLLCDAKSTKNENIVVIKYEDLLSEPEAQTRKLCAKLDLESQSSMLQYGAQGNPPWALGDQGLIYQASSVQKDNRDSWKQSLRDPAIWRLCKDYLDELGEDLYSRLGYDWEHDQNELAATRPNSVKSRLSLSLNYCLNGKDNYLNKYSRVLGERDRVLNLLSLTRTVD